MKKLMIFITILFLSLFSVFANSSDEDKIKELINRAYINGIHNNGDLNDVRNGFEPAFEMFLFENGIVTKLSIGDWIIRIEENKKKNPNPPINLASANFLSIDIVENTASIKFELLRGGKVLFTDFMYLYKINGDWKIVGKVYHRH
jgi:hypothetical protein